MELQLFIIWHNAIKSYPYIIEKLSSCFLIKMVYETTWNRAETLNKMIHLYQCTSIQAEKKSLKVDMAKLLLL